MKCGKKFTIPQELSRHIRDKVCVEVSVNTYDSNDSPTKSRTTLLPKISSFESETNLYTHHPAVEQHQECLNETSHSPKIMKLNSVENTETTETIFNAEFVINDDNNDDDHVNDNKIIVKTITTESQQQQQQSTTSSTSTLMPLLDAGEKQKGVSNSFGCSQCIFR